MVDHRRFLTQAVEQVLPWLGGMTLTLPDRQLRLTTRPPAVGWYTFSISGRKATLLRPAEPLDVSQLPLVRGVWSVDRLIIDGRRSARVYLLPEEEPPQFAPLHARQWHSGDLLFESVEFESEIEPQLRQSLAKNEAISTLKGLTPAHRTAYGLALLSRVSQRLHVPFSAAEMQRSVLEVSEQGVTAAEAALRALEAERALAIREWSELQKRLAAVELEREVERSRAVQKEHTQPAERAEAALEKVGGRLESIRHLGTNRMEVIFEYADHRFIAVVDAQTLRIIDSGICLGHPPRDDVLTLESLPGVIQEAINDDVLVILRHP